MDRFLSMKETNEKVPFWWQIQDAVDMFTGLFEKQHLLRMFFDYKTDDKKSSVKVYSGIVFQSGDLYCWLTAGHIIKDLEKAIRIEPVKINAMMWADGLPVPFPVHDRDNLEFYYFPNNNIDIGYIILKGMDKSNLLKNNYIKPMNIDSFKAYTGEIVGYYLVGYPSESVENLGIDADGMRRLKTKCYCLPVQKLTEIPEVDYVPNGEFFGSICDKYLFDKVVDVEGMSGGPLISIYLKNNQLFYRLAGIQRGWFQNNRIIIAETFESLLLKDKA